MAQLAEEPRPTQVVGAHVDAGTRRELLRLAKAEDRSLASVIRRALARELERANQTGDEA